MLELRHRYPIGNEGDHDLMRHNVSDFKFEDGERLWEKMTYFEGTLDESVVRELEELGVA